MKMNDAPQFKIILQAKIANNVNVFVNLIEERELIIYPDTFTIGKFKIGATNPQDDLISAEMEIQHNEPNTPFMVDDAINHLQVYWHQIVPLIADAFLCQHKYNIFKT